MPFGPRKLTGIVTGYGSDEGKLKYIESVLDDKPALTAEMLERFGDRTLQAIEFVLDASLPHLDRSQLLVDLVDVLRADGEAGGEWKGRDARRVTRRTRCKGR